MEQSILLVDDDALVRQTFVEILQLDGYRVTGVADVAAARAALAMPYDVVISDVQLGAVNGGELYDVIARERPALVSRLIFMTGDVADPRVRSLVGRTGVPVLSKPVRLDDLLRAVRVVLDAPPAGRPGPCLR